MQPRPSISFKQYALDNNAHVVLECESKNCCLRRSVRDDTNMIFLDGVKGQQASIWRISMKEGDQKFPWKRIVKFKEVKFKESVANRNKFSLTVNKDDEFVFSEDAGERSKFVYEKLKSDNQAKLCLYSDLSKYIVADFENKRVVLGNSEQATKFRFYELIYN